MASFVGGDGEQPGLELSRKVKVRRGNMKLQERLLEDIFGQGMVAGKPHQEVV
jgi:hypothetical protein